MITQGFPLWAVDEDGVTYAVVGWDDADPVMYAALVPLNTQGRPVSAVEGPATGLLRFTTERPTPVDANASACALADLRERMDALADRIVERDMDTLVAGEIRRELEQ